MSIPTWNEETSRFLRTILERGAENASQALSKWLGRPVWLEIGAVEAIEIEAATGMIGPGESLLAAAIMTFSGRLSGLLILVFEDQAGLALADFLLRQPIGTSQSWGDLERSAAQETANIVGCAYLNALAAHLPGETGVIVPGPPEFRHEFAASLIEFALLDQAAQADQVFLIETRFHAEPSNLPWSLLFVPSAAARDELGTLLGSNPK